MKWLCGDDVSVQESHEKSGKRLENSKRTGKTLSIPCYESFTRLAHSYLFHLGATLGSLKSKVVLISKVRKTKEKLAASREGGKEKVVVEGSTQAALPRVRQFIIRA